MDRLNLLKRVLCYQYLRKRKSELLLADEGRRLVYV